MSERDDAMPQERDQESHRTTAADLAYQAARMYYVDNATQATIAERLDVSRPTVSRLVTEARRLGLVRIEVVDPRSDERGVLAVRLQEALGLDGARVVPPVHPSRLGPDLAPAVGAEIEGMGLEPGDVLLLSSGRTVYEVVREPLPKMTGVQVVPTVGGLSEPVAWYQTNEIARLAAESTGAFPAFLFTEVLPTVPMRRSLDEDPTFRHVLALWQGARAAVVGIGAPTATRHSISRSIPAEASHFRDAVGDVCMNFFDASGAAIEFPGSDRMVRTPRELLQGLDRCVGVAVGVEKVPSIVGAVRAGMVRSLVTDAPTARALLEALDRPAARRS
ncbi:sugar-binding transcriptional regulator [Isoptericola cucumis]|uniref:Transcriptional regulator n=1 Tax=Isoptericola cucumis TaxID=1776856 RepID=A0ABQ2B4W0_9MICO|nr:sugar-binding domain-containing protein [Isoptericola cucumis]GGI08017.1 transcriptional regulator [Isoptericola cucumis]